MVDLGEEQGEGGEHGVEGGVHEAVVQQEEGGVFLEEEDERVQGVREADGAARMGGERGGVGGGRVREGGGGAGRAPGSEVGHQSHVPRGRGHGAVAHDATARLGEEEREGHEEHEGHDGQEPEDGRPAQELGQHAAQHGADRGPDHRPRHRVPHVGAPLRRARHVGHHPVRQRHRPAAAGALQAPQRQQGREAALPCQPDVGDEVEREAQRVGGASAGGVGEVAEEGWGQALEDHVRGEGQVDLRAGDGEVGG